MSLLEVHKLTMQFGGLTAVGDVDLDVPQGTIFSVIGPNGAGKTTVFNAITGIYEPTSGTIRCAGSELRRPFSYRVVLFCLAIGIATSMAAFLLSLDVNQLWRATIVRNMHDVRHRFSWDQAWNDFRGYLAGRLAVEPSKGSWAVVPWNASRPIFGRAPSRGDAQAIAQTLDDCLNGKTGLNEAIRRIGASPNEVFATPQMIAEVSAARRLQLRIGWLSAILGLIVATAGSFAIWSRSRRTPDVIAASGIARTFQNIRLLSSMTVMENVQVALDRRLARRAPRWWFLSIAWLLIAGGMVWVVVPWLWQPSAPGSLKSLAFVLLPELAILARAQWLKRADERESARLAYDSLGVVGLQSRASELAGSLAYGQQRRLEIARALALQPRLLLLDEPAAGMNPTESVDLTGLIRRIRDRGVTVLLIEHHMNVVMGISDRIAVLDHGLKIAEGTPSEVRTNPQVIAAYLGAEEPPQR